MSIFKKIIAFFRPMVSAFFSSLIDDIAANGGKLLVESARAAVLAAEQQGGSGSDKLNAARAIIIQRLSSNGYPVVISAINGAIEAAVAELKKGKL